MIGVSLMIEEHSGGGGGGAAAADLPSAMEMCAWSQTLLPPNCTHSLVDLKAVCERCRQILESCGPGRMHNAALPLRRSSACPSGDKGQNSTKKHLTFVVCSVFLCACVSEFSSSFLSP